MPNVELDPLVEQKQQFQSITDVCNCELCHARLYVSVQQSIEDEYACMTGQTDGFHLTTTQKSIGLHSQNMSTPVIYPWLYQMPLYTNMSSVNCNPYVKCAYTNGNKANLENSPFSGPPYDKSCQCIAGQLCLESDVNRGTTALVPHVYISKDCVLHIRLSTYVSFERSLSAYRLINYRNNSALALNENGEYGYAYHYNCRGLINMHHGKLSLTFEKDRQILLRTDKPSFVKKEMEFYKLTSHHWTACRPVSMDTFDRDRTPEILKKHGSEKSHHDSKLRDLVNSSAVHKNGCGMISDAKIEQKVNGDVVLSWFYEDRFNSLIVSPLSGGFSLSTKNLEIMATPKGDIYIAFTDFFVHVGCQQMTVSSGAVLGPCNLNKGHPCILRLTSTALDNQSTEMRQYCAYSQSINPSAGHSSSTYLGYHAQPTNSVDTNRGQDSAALKLKTTIGSLNPSSDDCQDPKSITAEKNDNENDIVTTSKDHEITR